MTNPYNEFGLVQLPALIHLTRLGYKYLSTTQRKQPEFDLDQETNILKNVFKKHFLALNPLQDYLTNESNDIDDETRFEIAYRELKDCLKNNDLGREFLQNINKYIDFNNPENNSYHCTAELNYENNSFRSDVTLFINGLPLVLMEFKKPHNLGGMNIEKDRMQYQRLANSKSKHFQNITQIMIFSNNLNYESFNSYSNGSFYATGSNSELRLNRFKEDSQDFIQSYPYFNINIEKTVNEIMDGRATSNFFNLKRSNEKREFEESIKTSTPTNSFLTSLCCKERLLFILKFGITFVDRIEKTNNGKEFKHIYEKHIIRYQQLLACEAVIKAIDKEKRKSGIIWHTQGSGKTALTYFLTRVLDNYFAKKGVVTKYYFVVDRLDLLDQAQKEFEKRNLKVITAIDRQDFSEKLRNTNAFENNTNTDQITVVNIQRFEDNENDKEINFHNQYGKIQRVFIVDEAHRSYDKNGVYLKNLLNADPNAILIALTGTPLIGDEKTTKDIFGDYIHIYHQSQSVQDGYTLKIKFDTKKPILERVNFNYELLKQIQVSIKEIPIKEIILHDQYVLALIKDVLKDLHDFRLKCVINNIGGMLLCSSREQAIKVQENFDKALVELKKADPNFPNMQMRLVVSNEEHQGQEHIVKELKAKKNYKDLYEEHKQSIAEFKADNSTIDLLVVYQMLITGFDAPRLKRLYVNRNLDGHTLLQAITRVNRPYENIPYGHVIDYWGISENYINTREKYRKELENFLSKQTTNNQTNNDYNTLNLIDYKVEKKDYKEILSQATSILVSNNIFLNDPNICQSFNENIVEMDLQTLNEVQRALLVFNENLLDINHEELKNWTYLENVDYKKLNYLINTLKLRKAHISSSTQRKGSENIAKILQTELDKIEFSFKTIDIDVDLDGYTKKLPKEVSEAVNRLKKNINHANFHVVAEDQKYITMLDAILLRLQQINIETNLENTNEQNLLKKNFTEHINKFNNFVEHLYKTYTEAQNYYDGDKKYISLFQYIHQGNLPNTESSDTTWAKDPEKLKEFIKLLEIKVEEVYQQRKQILDEKEQFSWNVTHICTKLPLKKLGIKLTSEQRNNIANFLYDKYKMQHLS